MNFDLDDEDERIATADKQAAISGGLAGGMLSGANSVLGGERNVRAILLKSLLGAAALGGSAAGATHIGSKLLGAPEEGEAGGYSHRAGLGGLVGGGLAGAGLGYLVGSGKSGRLAKMMGKIPGFAEALEKPGPLNNMVTDRLKKIAALGGRSSNEKGLLGAGLLGTIGGTAGGLHGYFEGADIDSLQNERRRRQLREEAYP